MLEKIQRCFKQNRVLYSMHARNEMRSEEFGAIKEKEVFDSIVKGELIEEYPEDKPYPSVLIFGTTSTERPIHIVCAYIEEENLSVVITAYQPNPESWIDYRRRRS